VRVDRDEGEAITVDVAGSVQSVRPGETMEVRLSDPDTSSPEPAEPDAPISTR
jgi:hypothetical protein